MIFADSPRQVDQAQAASIRKAVPSTRLCGVFRDAGLGAVVELSEAVDLDLIQLHGNESPEYCAELMERTGLPVIKSLIPEELSPSVVDSYARAAYLMIDLPKDDPAKTGSGKQKELAELVAMISRSGREVFLAGGLNPENVNSALSAEPFAVDVCSGIECEPGRKDLARVAAQRRLGDHDTRLRIDVAGYRERRQVALGGFARKVAAEVRESNEARSMEPMASADRKVVHDVLNEEDGVTTRSVGEDPNRRIVVEPA